MSQMSSRRRVPRDCADDYTNDAARARREFLGERTGASLEHVSRHSFDPHVTRGNIEYFVGVAQVPIGVAGPLLVDGEHAQGEFYVPLATAEGTLVASYNRGMRLLYEAGGVKTTVTADRMQRAPVFIFPSARLRRVAERALRRCEGGGRDDHRRGLPARHRAVLCRPPALHPFQLHDRRRGRAEHDRQGHPGGVPVDRRPLPGHRVLPARGLIRHRQQELAGEHAAHQRQARRGRGADPWRADRAHHAHDQRDALPGATDQQPRRLHGRREQQRCPFGQRHHRVVHRHRAGCRERRRVLRGLHLRRAARERRLLLLGDHPGADRRELRGRDRIAQQRECLELLACYGTGKVRKLAEIVAATVLCGELSLGSAVVAGEWVDAHDQLGRNRP